MAFIGSASAINVAEIGIGDGYGYVTMPITVTNGTNVGSIQLNMTFDPDIVTIVGVAKGDMDSMLSNSEHIGEGYIKVIAYQASNPGLNGTFAVAQVTFQSVASSGTCPLNITVKTFKDSTPQGNVMAYTISNGTYTATSGGHSGSGGGGGGTYPPEPTPTNGGSNATPTQTDVPTPTPTLGPTPSPTKNLPDDDGDDATLLSLEKVLTAIGLLIAAAIAIVVKLRKKNE